MGTAEIQTIQSRSRRQLWMLLLLALFYLAADQALYWALWRSPGQNLTGRALRDRAFLQANPDARQLLVIGDSRVKWSIDAQRLALELGLTDGLNMAYPNGRIGDDLAVVRWLEREDNAADVRVLVWGMGLDRFHEHPYAAENLYVLFDPWARGYGLSGLTDFIGRTVTPAAVARSSVQAIIDGQRRSDAWQSLWAYDMAADYAERGFLPNPDPPDPEPGFGDYYQHPRVRAGDASKLAAAVQRLRARGITVVIADTPVAPALAEYYQRERPEAISGYRAMLDQLEQAGAVVVREAELPHDAMDFTDPIHLTAGAAEQYMRLLIGRLATP